MSLTQQPKTLAEFLKQHSIRPIAYIKPQQGAHVVDLPDDERDPDAGPEWKFIRLTLAPNVCVPFHATTIRDKNFEIKMGLVLVLTRDTRGIHMTPLPDSESPDNKNNRFITAGTEHALVSGPDGAILIVKMTNPDDKANWPAESEQLVATRV